MNNNNLIAYAIDDEPLALDVIKALATKNGNIEIKRTFNNGLTLLEAVKKDKPDVIFLDIQMPEISGMDVANVLKDSGIALVFTTAYSEYAVDAFDIKAVDYVSKPISQQRFDKSVARCAEYKQMVMDKPSLEDTKDKAVDYIYVKSKQRSVKIMYSDILYVEAFADYVKIYIDDNKRIVTLNTMKKMNEALPNDIFARVHRSYIINLYKVESLKSTEVRIGTKTIPVGKNYKGDFEKAMSGKNML